MIMRAATVVQVLQDLFYVLLHALCYLWSLHKVVFYCSWSVTTAKASFRVDKSNLVAFGVPSSWQRRRCNRIFVGNVDCRRKPFLISPTPCRPTPDQAFEQRRRRNILRRFGNTIRGRPKAEVLLSAETAVPPNVKREFRPKTESETESW